IEVNQDVTGAFDRPWVGTELGRFEHHDVFALRHHQCECAARLALANEYVSDRAAEASGPDGRVANWSTGRIRQGAAEGERLSHHLELKGLGRTSRYLDWLMGRRHPPPPQCR